LNTTKANESTTFDMSWRILSNCRALHRASDRNTDAALPTVNCRHDLAVAANYFDLKNPDRPGGG